MKIMKKIELLSPAKDLDCGMAAIKCGADAVYIGADSFGARSSAGNSIEDIKTLVSFAHMYFARVYVTLNTILTDKEIIQAKELLEKLYETGVDAFIIQDMGFLEMDLPPVPLFASTQCHNNSVEKIKFLEQVGFNRVILARELSLEEIKHIREKTEIELEFFVHGALCVCYSGQCYLSYAIGGRSGNRGDCAQPCRKIYSLVDESGHVILKNKHLLSLKDLNLSDYIKDLVDSGINSFKIEGRLKDINYVKNIVSFYRQKIDRAGYKKTSAGNISIDFTPDPEKTFNRGYTDYFLMGRRKDITSFDTPKSTGKECGTVFKCDKISFYLKSHSLKTGDGICFFDDFRILRGTSVKKVENNRIFPDDMSFIKKDTLIYRNLDIDFLKHLKHAKIERKISIKLTVSEENGKILLTAVDEDNIKASLSAEINIEIARNREKALFNLKKQLSSLGETEFLAEHIEINLKDIYFITVKEINNLRRKLVEMLRKKREDAFSRKLSYIEKNNYPFPDETVTFRGNVMNILSERFYARHGAKVIEPAAETGMEMKGHTVMKTKHCLKYSAGICPGRGCKKTAPLYLVDEKGKKYLLQFNCNDCTMEVIFY
ncbi:MAG: U32 family peptidase [Candidatus Eremiobacterota bacterium]